MNHHVIVLSNSDEDEVLVVSVQPIASIHRDVPIHPTVII